MHMNQEGQQIFKTKRVKDCLERIGHIDVEVQPCFMQNTPWYYRNKVQMPIGYNKDHYLITGFYKQRTNDIIACQECLIQNHESNDMTFFHVDIEHGTLIMNGAPIKVNVPNCITFHRLQA